MNIIDNNTKLFFSAAKTPGNFGATIYNKLFLHYNINAVYLPKRFCSTDSIITCLNNLDIHGCSITMPFKSKILKFLDITDTIVEQTESVNTVVKRDDLLYGYNTDYFAIGKILENLAPENTIIYGSGSVVHSIVYNLLNKTNITVISRNEISLNYIKEKFSVNTVLEDSEKTIKSCDLLINATPASNDSSSYVFKLLKNTSNLFDLYVQKGDTLLCTEAKKTSIPYIRGIDMSKWQLQKQFDHYVGILPDIDIINNIVYSNFL